MKLDIDLAGDQCIVCNGERNPEFFVNSKGYKYYRCKSCQCIYIDNNTEEDSYPKNALKENISFIRDYRCNRLWVWAISDSLWIQDYIKSTDFIDGGSALSVGCAYAHDLYELRKKGWEVLGLDHDADFVDRVKLQHGISVVNSSIEKAKFNKKFDLIILMGVLPYIYDIKRTFKKINSLLNDGGYLVIGSRSVDFNRGQEVLSYPTNVYARQYFSEKSFGILLSSFGFNVIAIDSFNIKEPIIEKIPEKLKQFKIGFRNYTFKPVLELINIFYVVSRIFKLETYQPSTRINSNNLRIIAKKQKMPI
jgi:hypothetical protein